MRIFRNILFTLVFMTAIAAAAIFGYYRFRAGKEIDLMTEGISLMEQGSYRSARTKFSDAQQYENNITRRLSDDTLEEDLYRYTAICDFRLGDYEEAAFIFDKLLILHPRDSSLLSSRASVYAALGQMEKAEAMFDTAIAIDRSNYSRIYTAALTMREYGGEEAGQKYFQKLLAEHEQDLDPVTRGQALCYLKKYEEAVNVLNEIENPDIQTSFLLASAMEEMELHEEALAILAEYEDQIGTYPDMLNLKGTALCSLEKYKEALVCFEEALPLSQEGSSLRRSILFNRIAALEHLREFKKAAELSAEYVKAYPKDKLMNRENNFLQTR